MLAGLSSGVVSMTGGGLSPGAPKRLSRPSVLPADDGSGISYDPTTNTLILRQRAGQTANLFEVRAAVGSLSLSINSDGGHLAPTFLDPVSSLRTNGYVENSSGIWIDSHLTASTGAAGDVLVVDTATANKHRKATTGDTGAFVVGIGGWVNAPAWVHTKGKITINVDAGAVAIGDRLVISDTVAGAAKALSTDNPTLTILGTALSAKAAGANGTVTMWFEPRRGRPALPVYANNAAALAGGLGVGAFYRTGADPDPVCVVH